MSDLNQELEELRLSPKWLESGFITIEWLKATFQRFCHSEDKSTEHYRYSAFRFVLASKQSFSDEEIEKYIELAEMDADKGMAEAALAGLIGAGLTQDQLNWLAQHPAYQIKRLQRFIYEKKLLREIEQLENGQVTEEQFQRYLKSKSDIVQRVLLWGSKLSQAQIEVLSICGTNKAVRNIAKDKLRRKDYREKL